MAIAVGVARQPAYKVETSWGVLPTAGSAQLLRRTKLALNLKKDTYTSAEIRTDYQDAVFTHGMRKVDCSLSGELSPGSYRDFMQASVRRDFAAVTAITGASITVAASGTFYTLTRAAGSYLTDGVRKGMVVRLTAGAFSAANLNRNFLVVTVTATVATVAVVDSLTPLPVTEGPIATATVTIIGKTTFAPLTGHVNRSFSIEDWQSDVSQSERYSGLRLDSMMLKFPPTGMSTVDFAFMGKDVATATSQYFTSPTAASSTGTVAGINGVLVVNGVKLITLSGLNINVKGNMSTEAVNGSNTTPDVFQGRIQIDGDFNAFYEDGALRDIFLSEAKVGLAFVSTVDPTSNSDFIAGYLPSIKLNDASKEDSDKVIKRAYPFKALLNTIAGAGDETTTIQFQDSLA